MSNSLSIIQKVHKFGKIISRIEFVACIVGVIGCLVGILSLYFIPDTIQIGGLTVHGMIEKSSEVSIGDCYTAMLIGMIVSAGGIFLGHKGIKYFKYELEIGTPFTFDGANLLKKLGICNILTSVVTSVLSAIAYVIMSQFYSGIGEFHGESNIGSFGLGLVFIFTAVVFRYGAELSSDREENLKI